MLKFALDFSEPLGPEHDDLMGFLEKVPDTVRSVYVLKLFRKVATNTDEKAFVELKEMFLKDTNRK